MQTIFLLKKSKRGKQRHHVVTLGRNGEPVQHSEKVSSHNDSVTNANALAMVFFDMFQEEGLFKKGVTDEFVSEMVNARIKNIDI